MSLLSADKPQLFQLPPVLGSGRDEIDPGGRKAGVAQDVRQFDNVPGRPVERPGEQVAQVVGEDLPGGDARLFAEGFHLRPNLFPV